MIPLTLETRSSVGILTLMGIRGIGSQTADRIASVFSHFGDIVGNSTPAVTALLPATLKKTGLTEESLARAYDEAQTKIDRARFAGVRLISRYEPEFPELLRDIDDSPVLLYVKGELGDRKAVACVGTREPTRFGAETARRTATFLAQEGWTIVSGLALGVDTISHEAALAARGRTVAVLANGLDSVYPKANRELAERILEAGGALVSEQPLGAPPTGANLVRRDRLQSGMSLAVVVFQTDIVGGTMHTVRAAVMQGRDIFAPSPSGAHANEEKSRGIVAMTTLPAQAFAELMKADSRYKERLERRGDGPLARALHTRHDFLVLRNRLEQLYNSGLRDERQLGLLH